MTGGWSGLDTNRLCEMYGGEVPKFLQAMESDIEPFRELVGLLFEEHSIFQKFFDSTAFSVREGMPLVELIDYILLLKQYEMGNQAIVSLIRSDYMVCATLIRSMFETNMISIYLSKHPEDADDFVAFSEIVSNPEIDWKKHGISNNKRDRLRKKFSQGRLMDLLYSGTGDDGRRINTGFLYQKLCNITHPNLHPSHLFYSSSSPPESSFSNKGIRETLTQLLSMFNQCNELLAGSFLKDMQLVEACYLRRKEMYRLHDEATLWHKKNPTALPPFTKNEEFCIGWRDGKPIITCYKGSEKEA